MNFKFFKISFVILGLIMLFSCSSNNKTSDVNDFKKVLLNRVVDGNTIKISLDGKLENVRLLLIDAPELRGNYPFASEAKRFVEKKLQNYEHVYLELDSKERDEHGKMLAYVWYYDDKELKMLNDEIVKEGFARIAYVFDNAKYLNLLNESQEYSKKQNNNIWSINGYVTDKGYKKMKL